MFSMESLPWCRQPLVLSSWLLATPRDCLWLGGHSRCPPEPPSLQEKRPRASGRHLPPSWAATAFPVTHRQGVRSELITTPMWIIQERTLPPGDSRLGYLRGARAEGVECAYAVTSRPHAGQASLRVVSLTGRWRPNGPSEWTMLFTEGQLVKCVCAAEVKAVSWEEDEPLAHSHGLQGKCQCPRNPAGASKKGAEREF